MERKAITINPTTGDLHQLPDEDRLNGVDYGYIHEQQLPAAVWTITHNKGRYPSSVTVVTSAGDIVWTDVVLVDLNTIQTVSDSAFSGKVYLRF
jgi:hypothetical protein